MRHQNEDLAYGEQCELNLRDTVEHIAGCPIDWRGGLSIFDYKNSSNTVYVELKSRRIKHNEYSTALIGKNKVDFCNDPTRNYYFVYNYLDGIFYIKYDKALFDTFTVQEKYMRSYRAGCSNNPSDVVHIPYTALKKFVPVPTMLDG